MKLNSINSYNSNVNAVKIKSPAFTANPARAPFYPETLETIDSVYRDYKKSLGETSLSDIKSTVLKLSQETKSSKKEVLEAMQLVTQFSNIRGLKSISDAISKHNVKSIGDKDMSLQFHAYADNLTSKNQRLFYTETGINSLLSYIFDKKRLAPINYNKKGKLGIVLDEEKISQLEQIKKSQPEAFKTVVNSKDLQYFYISGWDTGIPVVNRTKSLEDTTRDLLLRAKGENKPLEKVLDAPLLDRVKELGLKPVVIKNENPATELSVYNQMKPQQISKSHLTNMIEANSIYRASVFAIDADKKKASMNHQTAKYLEDTLCVYTPEKMSADLKAIHEKIMDYANSQGKDVLFINPKTSLKSTDYVNYSYKKINNVDSSKFVSIHSVKDYNRLYPEKPPITPENTLLVVLDDCAISGDSISEIRITTTFEARVPKEYSLLFANLKGTDEAYSNFYRKKHRNPADFIMLDRINLKNLQSDESLQNVVGSPVYTKNASSIVFPYMAPDNNSEFASNIALLHNLKYNSQNFSNLKNRSILTSDYEYYNSGIKTMTSNVKKASIRYINMLGFNPKTFEESLESDVADSTIQEHKSLWDKFVSLFKK